MDFDEYWQENKRFVGIVFTGFLVFMIARMSISSTIGGEVTAAQKRDSRERTKLKAPMYDNRDRDSAKGENDALVQVADKLKDAVGFVPREAFTLSGSLSPSARYHAALAQVREDVLPLASRANMVVDNDLGQPDLSPTREEEIVRHLEALDLIDRALRLSLDVGMARVDKIHVALDAGLRSKGGVGVVENTRVELELGGDGAAVLEFIRRSQEPELVIGGRAFTILSLNTRQSKRAGETQVNLSLAVVRLHSVTILDAEEL
jgi:hypothetical protein